MTQIINRFTGKVITEGDMNLRELVLYYVKTEREAGRRPDLRGSNLRGSNLSYSDLSYSDLRDSDLSDSNLSYSDLRYSDLRGSNLRGSNLRDSDLRGSDIRGSNLRDSDLRGSNLSGSNLRGSNLSGSNLSGSDLSGVKIKKTAVFTGLYKYIVMPVIAEDGAEYIRMGCFSRTVAEWEANFWNNPSEFPNKGDMPSKLRWMAYQTALVWLGLNRDAK